MPKKLSASTSVAIVGTPHQGSAKPANSTTRNSRWGRSLRIYGLRPFFGTDSSYSNRTRAGAEIDGIGAGGGFGMESSLTAPADAAGTAGGVAVEPDSSRDF